LYYYVRQMDSTVERIKDIPNLAEDKILEGNEENTNVGAQMMRYFLCSENVQDNSIGLEGRRQDNIPYGIGSDAESEDDDGVDDGVLLDEISKSSNENDREESVDGDYRLGDHMAEAWKERSEKLHMNIAIAGWMCSADPLVMKDVNDNHLGKRRDAVTALLKQGICMK
jgi:hypothetical protein